MDGEGVQAGQSWLAPSELRAGPPPARGWGCRKFRKFLLLGWSLLRRNFKGKSLICLLMRNQDDCGFRFFFQLTAYTLGDFNETCEPPKGLFCRKIPRKVMPMVWRSLHAGEQATCMHPNFPKMQLVCKSRKINQRYGNGASQEINSGNLQKRNIPALALH